MKASYPPGAPNLLLPYFVALTILFLLSLLIPRGQDVLWINGHHNQWLDSIFKVITNLGDGMIFLPLVLVALFVQFRYAVAAVILAVTHGILVTICKRILFPGMPRPRIFLGDENLHFVPGVEVHSINTFPSGHTTTAFCIALFIALWTKSRSTAVILLCVALTVGYSRIYLAQHFLHDVTAGAIAGTITTLFVWTTFEQSSMPAWMNLRLILPRFPSRSYTRKSIREGS